jgi:hypothetical protein
VLSVNQRYPIFRCRLTCAIRSARLRARKPTKQSLTTIPYSLRQHLLTVDQAEQVSSSIDTWFYNSIQSLSKVSDCFSIILVIFCLTHLKVIVKEHHPHQSTYKRQSLSRPYPLPFWYCYSIASTATAIAPQPQQDAMHCMVARSSCCGISYCT